VRAKTEIVVVIIIRGQNWLAVGIATHVRVRANAG
jgi:hypothetical protein